MKKAISILSMVLILVIGYFVGTDLAKRPSLEDYPATITITVKRGDTVWDIVKETYGEKISYDEACYFLIKDNALKSGIGTIHPGQKLILRDINTPKK